MSRLSIAFYSWRVQNAPGHVTLVGGCSDNEIVPPDVYKIATRAGVEPIAKSPLQAGFREKLRLSRQQEASTIMVQDKCLLCTPCPFNKAAVDAWLIGKREMDALVVYS